MSAQIQAYHHQKLAYIYLRQSTPGQVLHHRESTPVCPAREGAGTGVGANP